MSAPQSALIDLDDTDLTVANPREDVRGEQVFDRHGDDVGKVDGLLIDQREQRVRFLQVGSGGFLGLGKKERLIPVDVVTGLDDDGLHIDMARDKVADSPTYDPAVVDSMEYGSYGSYYDHYGATPYWAPGYVNPGFPHR